MIEYLYSLLYAVGFALGVVMTCIGGIFIHQLFVQGKQFRSQMVMIALSILLSVFGLSLLWLALV